MEANKKNSVEETVFPVGSSDTGAENSDATEKDSGTAQKVQGALDQIAQDMAGVTELIREALPDEDWQDQTPSGSIQAPCGYSEVLVAHHDRGGMVTEEYRSLRTNLLARYAQERFCFLVTSAEAGEGKTVTCLNLAFVLAERVDHRTIVVDFNLRNSQMAELLKVPSSPGVADYLRGKSELSQIIQPTVYPNLFFIPAGNLEGYQASELLGRSGLKKLIAQVREDFDYVLLDTPSVNKYSDAGVAGLEAGDALLVVRMNKTRREAVTQAIQSLQNANINLIGMLMTHQKKHFFN